MDVQGTLGGNEITPHFPRVNAAVLEESLPANHPQARWPVDSFFLGQILPSEYASVRYLGVFPEDTTFLGQVGSVVIERQPHFSHRGYRERPVRQE